jgi:hypothetical protein
VRGNVDVTGAYCLRLIDPKLLGRTHFSKRCPPQTTTKFQAKQQECKPERASPREHGLRKII